MSSALEDVIVLDLTRDFSSCLAAAFLADFGGRVIRVELLNANDPVDESKGTWDFESDLIHRNKQSFALDPAAEKGRQLLAELVAKADVLLTDWMIPDLVALSLDYASVSAANPSIIYGRSSGFGPKGPDKDLPAIDELASARTGMMPILGQPGEPPVYTGAGAMHNSVMLAFGVVTALIHRQSTGEGQQVDTSLFAANMYGASLDIQAFLAIGEGDRFINPISRLDVSNPMSGSLYPSKNRLELIHLFEERFQTQPGSHWRQVFAEKQMSADVIEQFDYPAEDPQALANRYIMELDHPSFGKVKSLGFPIFMSDSPARLQNLAPCKGQHSGQVLHDLLGYSEDAIYKLTSDGVIA
ncbi:MAG: CoA transferase [Deltaproteobacteria bacterium]|nr:CoA transferase [Deltaproteobacteria bacterium]